MSSRPATPLLLGSVLQQKTPAIVGFTSARSTAGWWSTLPEAGVHWRGLITGNGIGVLTLIIG